MKLSVIIPYFNSNAWIGKTLDSLLEQDIDISEYEIIVVDDGSEEEAVVLKDYVSRFSQIHYYRISHSGLSLARNYDLSIAQGEWIYFCDSDDYVQTQVFGGIIAVAEERQLEMICANSIRLKENDPIPKQRREFTVVSKATTGIYFFPEFPVWGVWLYMIRRSFIEEMHLLFDDISYVEERLFTLNLIKTVSRVAKIDVDLYYYVQHEESILHSNRKQNGLAFAEAMIVYLDKLTELIEEPTTPLESSNNLRKKRAYDTLVLIMHMCRFCQTNEIKSIISHLEEIGAYPIEESDHEFVRKFRGMVNHKTVLFSIHKAYRVIPKGIVRNAEECYKRYSISGIQSIIKKRKQVRKVV